MKKAAGKHYKGIRVNIKFQPEKNVWMSNLGHDGEADPGADLVGVVGAGAQVEQAC